MLLWMLFWSIFLTDILGLTAALGLSPAGLVRSKRPIPRTDGVSSSFTEPRNSQPPQPTGVHDAPNAQLSEARLARGQSSTNDQGANLPSTYFMGKKIPLNVLMSPAAKAFWSAKSKSKKEKQTHQPDKSANMHHTDQQRQPIRDQLHGDLHRGRIIKQPVPLQQNFGNMHHGVRGQPVRHWSNHGNLSHGPLTQSQQNYGNVHYGSNTHNGNHRQDRGNSHYDSFNAHDVKQQNTMLRVGETIMETRKGSPSANFFDVSHFQKNYYPHPPTNYQQTHQNQPFPGHDVDTRFSFKRQLRKLEYIRKHKTNHTKSKSNNANVSQTDKSSTTGQSDRKTAMVEYFKRKKQLQELLEQKRRESLNNIQKQPRVPLARQSRNNIPGVTRSPILTATMLGQDMKNTTDIPEEIEINGVSCDSPHDMNGKPHPLSPGFNQQSGQPQAPGPPPPLPNSRNAPNTVTRRPILTATMLGQDMKNTTDIPEEIEINGTSYDSPHDMNGKPHPLVPGSGFYAQQHVGPANPMEPHVRFAPTTPPPYFNDLPGMTTVDFFGNSNAKSSIQGPPLPHHALIPAGRSRSETTHLPTYRTVPATYAPPPPPQQLYTVPATYAPPEPHQSRVVIVPATYAPPAHVNKDRYHIANKQTDSQPPADQRNYHEPANQSMYHAQPTAAPSPAPPPPPQTLHKDKQSPKSDIESGLSLALGTKGNGKLQSKFAATINEALQGKVRNAVDKAITSQVLDTLDSIISARIESLLSGGELAKNLHSSKQPTTGPVSSKQSNSVSVSSKHIRPAVTKTERNTVNRSFSGQSFGLTIENKPFSNPSQSQSSTFTNSRNRPRNRLRYSGG